MDVSGTVSATVNNLNQYETYNGQALTHTTAGNLQSDGTRTFTYDAGRPPDIGNLHRHHLHLRPLRPQIHQNRLDSETTTFIYDAEDVIAEYNDQGQLTKKYIHGPGH